MDTEMDAMKSNHTWELLPLARGAKPLRVMWVFTLKGGTEGEGGEKLRFKARLVAKGCSQRPGLDFGEVYAPVGRAQTIRSVLAMAAARDLEVHQLDFTTAFLNGALGEEVWVQQAEGYEVGGGRGRAVAGWNGVLKPNIECFGCHQFGHFQDRCPQQPQLQEFGFKEGDADPGLVFKGEGLERV